MNKMQMPANTALLLEMGLGPLWIGSEPEPLNHALAVNDPVEDAGASAATATANANAFTEHVSVAEQAEPVKAMPVLPEPSEVPEGAALPEMAKVVFDRESELSDETLHSPEIIQPDAPPASAPESAGVAVMSWQELQDTVSQCQRCGLCRERNKTVFGVGDQQAPWLFVGEGPGYYENQQGEPFVGAAGRLLDNMLKSLGVQRGQRAYIANIVKCRPTDQNGKDRPPSPDEVAACLPYLQRQITLIQPRVIVALGKTAAISLLGLPPETPVSQLRGKRHEVNGVPLIVTYHPAYLLRQPGDKAKVWRDLCLARTALN